MTSSEEPFDPDVLEDVLAGRRGVREAGAPVASAARLANRLSRLQPSGPSREASTRMEARFARLVERPQNPLDRLFARLGFGPAGPGLVHRFAAGAAILGVLGGTTYATTGATPVDVVSRGIEVVSSAVTNLDPRDGGEGAGVTSTPSPSATAGPDTPVPSATTAVPGTTTPGPRETASPGSAGDPGTTPPVQTPSGTSTPGSDDTATPRAEATRTPGPSETPATPATPGSTRTPNASPTPTPSRTATPVVATSTHAAGPAGTVTLRREGELLTVVSVQAAGGWAFEIDRPSGATVEVSFTRGADEVRFEAEVVDGQVEVRVDERPADGRSGGDDNSTADDGR